jgi:hypothetical protein
MADSVQIEKVFDHFRESFIKCKNIMRLKIGFGFELSLLNDGFALFGNFLFAGKWSNFFRYFRGLHVRLNSQFSFLKGWAFYFCGRIQHFLMNFWF